MTHLGGMARASCTAIILFASLLAGRQASAADAIEPFNGKDLSGWKFRGNAERSKWTVGTAKLSDADPAKIEATPGGNELINTARSVDLYTEAKFGDCRLEIEVLVPKGGNSGIFLMGNYEVQVFDSFGKTKVDFTDMGAIYAKTAPKINAAAAPGQWQKYVIDFRAPRFDNNGKKIANAKLVKCTLNGRVVLENYEIPGRTTGMMSREEIAAGPLMLQGDHGPIAYRNIKITPHDSREQHDEN